MFRGSRDAILAAAQVAVLVAAVAVATAAQAAPWQRDFTAADLEFFRPTAAEDPTGLTRTVTVGVLMPQETACVMLSVQQWHGGERVGVRRLVRHLAMPLDELLALVKAAQDPPRRAGSLGGPPVFGGVYQFYEGFGGFPERSSP